MKLQMKFKLIILLLLISNSFIIAQVKNEFKVNVLMEQVVNDSNDIKFLTKDVPIRYHKFFKKISDKKIVLYYYIKGKLSSTKESRFKLISIDDESSTVFRNKYDLIIKSDLKIEANTNNYVSLISITIKLENFQNIENGPRYKDIYKKFLERKKYRRDRLINIHIDCPDGKCEKEKTGSKKSGKVVTTNEEDDESGNGFAPLLSSSFMNIVTYLLAILGLGFGLSYTNRKIRFNKKEK